jgi:hypothetical protein
MSLSLGSWYLGPLRLLRYSQRALQLVQPPMPFRQVGSPCQSAPLMMGSQGYTRITPVSAKGSLRTVVATSPIKYKRRAATWLRLDALCAHVAVLLPICHDHAEFARIALDRVLPAIHRPSIQDGDFRQVTVRSWGHD